jgi:hypothetical protein
MNERIKLPDQEWLGYDPENGDIHGYTFEQMRDFTELIVRECMDNLEWHGHYEAVSQLKWFKVNRLGMK